MIRGVTATLLSIAVVIGVLVGAVYGFIWSAEYAATLGLPAGIPYFLGGFFLRAHYQDLWEWYTHFAEETWLKFHEWIAW